jgi:hypothetical protein
MRSPQKPSTVKRLTYLGVAGLAFQVGHFGEHLAQFGYWLIHPTATPWLSPWAIASRNALSSDPAFGVELLHLLGNALFLVGLLAIIAVPAVSRSGAGNLRTATALQVAHVAEHIALTATRMWGGTAIGISTAFGLLEGGQLSSYRVLWHFVVNLIVTVYAVRGLAEAARNGLIDDLAVAAAPG